MQKKPVEEIRSSKITDNQTWNSCLVCHREWKDTNPVPGLIHRTIICEGCLAKQDQHSGKANSKKANGHRLN